MDKLVVLIVLVLVLCSVGSCDRGCAHFAMKVNASPTPAALTWNDK